MQDVELKSIKLQLENLNSLIYSNNADLLSCVEKLYMLTSKNKFLNDEIQKRNMYFQDLYTDKNFNENILPPIIKHTLERIVKDDVTTYLPIGLYRNAEELNKDNWTGFYSDLFFDLNRFDKMELKIKGIIKCEAEIAYEQYYELVYETPKDMYIREIHYYLTLIRVNKELKEDIFYRYENEKFLTELLNLKEATLNITSLITFLISFIDSKIKYNISETDTNFKIQNKMNKINPLTDEEIKILRLRKNLSPDNTYKDIIKHLSTQTSESSLKQKVKCINNKLSGTNIDESIRFFENDLFSL